MFDSLQGLARELIQDCMVIDIGVLVSVVQNFLQMLYFSFRECITDLILNPSCKLFEGRLPAKNLVQSANTFMALGCV
ncbi:unnamed protein product [Moneuplotes crassus]|uniref:Uncharacterized protein n=1 Tax=Euplotes crassus TaxID=5936 RepID=A0AAD1Y6J5_EUPCR|nr:unnamed protein product [Moneuplotes crassus]